MTTLTGLDSLADSTKLQQSLKGKIAYLCHSASVNRELRSGIEILRKIYGSRLVKLFTPQHGLCGDVQANMIESTSFQHPYYKLPVCSLYSTTRQPTAEMLAGIDTILVDLQDVGTRVYTYIHTLTLLMEACSNKDIEVVILDRPNPINGETIEGNVLEPAYASFVGRYPIPMRHGLTIGEIALHAQKFCGVKCQLRVIPLENWQREFYFEDTRLPWIAPSPNMPTVTSALVYPGMVLFEGLSASEGRGTTKPFEIFGHPDLDPFASLKGLEKALKEALVTGVALRPLYFQPTFDKHQKKFCGGYQIHVTDRCTFHPWHFAQIIIRELRRLLGNKLAWNDPPYEYEYQKLPIDILNGSEAPRLWVEKQGDFEELATIEQKQLNTFVEQCEEILLYRE